MYFHARERIDLHKQVMHIITKKHNCLVIVFACQLLKFSFVSVNRSHLSFVKMYDIRSVK